MTANPSRPITLWLLVFLALCLVGLAAQQPSLLCAVLGALSSAVFGVTP